MFARNVSFHLKYNMLSEYGHVFESQVLPLLRKQAGFKDEITFASPSGLDVTAISLLDKLAKMIDGTPRVQTGEVVSSTFHKVATPVHA